MSPLPPGAAGAPPTAAELRRQRDAAFVQRLRMQDEQHLRQRQQQEMMKFYQENNINPLGGCLPLLLQMPVFIALYQVLANSIAMRRAPFMRGSVGRRVPKPMAAVEVPTR